MCSQFYINSVLGYRHFVCFVFGWCFITIAGCAKPQKPVDPARIPPFDLGDYLQIYERVKDQTTTIADDTATFQFIDFLKSVNSQWLNPEIDRVETGKHHFMVTYCDRRTPQGGSGCTIFHVFIYENHLELDLTPGCVVFDERRKIRYWDGVEPKRRLRPLTKEDRVKLLKILKIVN